MELMLIPDNMIPFLFPQSADMLFRFGSPIPTRVTLNAFIWPEPKQHPKPCLHRLLVFWIVARMGKILSKFQEVSHTVVEAETSFKVLYKMNSEEAVLRLSRIRYIVAYDDLAIWHLLGKMGLGGNLGVQLLGELKSLEEENSLTIRILRKRKLADRSDIYEDVKKMEDTCSTVRNLLDSLMACPGYRATGNPYQEKALKVSEEIRERKKDLLRLRLSSSAPKRTEVKVTTTSMRNRIQLLSSAIIGRWYQDSWA